MLARPLSRLNISSVECAKPTDQTSAQALPNLTPAALPTYSRLAPSGSERFEVWRYPAGPEGAPFEEHPRLMTKKILHRELKPVGPKPIDVPANAAETIRAHAADGWSVLGIAHCMGVSPRTLNRWIEEDPALKDAFDLGREQERRTLHNMLYRKAVEKNDTVAALAILNSRHGYRSDQGDQGNRVNVTIALPGAMTLQQFQAIGSDSKHE